MNGTKDFAFAQELSIEDRTKKEMHCVARKQHECSVRRGLPLGYGCRYTDAAPFNEVSKRCALQLLKTCGSGQGREEKRPDAAQVRSLCARRRMTMRRPQKNGGTEVETFFLGVARDARCDPRRQEKPGLQPALRFIVI